MGIQACTFSRVIFVTVFATSYMVIRGDNRPANALYDPPHRSRRRKWGKEGKIVGKPIQYIHMIQLVNHGKSDFATILSPA